MKRFFLKVSLYIQLGLYCNLVNGLSIQKKVFCFGDSLTAGSSPPLPQEFPYAINLEDKLRTDYPDVLGSALVRWKGFPGWTSKTLLDGGGLGSTLDKVQSSVGKVDLAIILAGSNDLAYDSDADGIFNTISQIHSIAHGRNVKTIALSIPPSSWQEMSQEARETAEKVNEKLKKMSASESGLCTFVPFPISYVDKSSGLWCSDGLHFSPEGYRFIGERLAPIVAEVLKSDI